MPQLDKVTFLSQFFWLCVFFFGFYIFQLKYFLPEMSRILKLRKKRLSESSSFTLQHENNEVRNNTSTLLENLLKLSKNVFKSSSSNIRDWFLKSACKLNKKDFKQGNIRYLDSVAEKSLSNNLAQLAVKLNFSENIFFSRGVKYCLILSKTPVSCVSQVESKSLKKLPSSNQDLNLVDDDGDIMDLKGIDDDGDIMDSNLVDNKKKPSKSLKKLPSSNQDSNLVDDDGDIMDLKRVNDKKEKSLKKLPSSNKDLNCCVDNDKKELTKVTKKGENKASKKKSKKL